MKFLKKTHKIFLTLWSKGFSQVNYIVKIFNPNFFDYLVYSTTGLHMNGVRSHAPTHAINLIRRAIIARHGFKYFTYGVRRAHALNTNHRHIARLEYKSKT